MEEVLRVITTRDLYGGTRSDSTVESEVFGDSSGPDATESSFRDGLSVSVLK